MLAAISTRKYFSIMMWNAN